MLRLALVGPDTLLLSTLCAACPEGPLGCCIAPPSYDWSDVGRVVLHGGRDFLLDALAAGHVVASARGLDLRRVRRRDDPRHPREKKCVFHGPRGCTILPSLRPATCNYFLCDAAYEAGGASRGEPLAALVRARHRALIGSFTAWDEALGREVAEVYPDGPPWDGPFLDWLADATARVMGPEAPARSDESAPGAPERL